MPNRKPRAPTGEGAGKAGGDGDDARIGDARQSSTVGNRVRLAAVGALVVAVLAGCGGLDGGPVVGTDAVGWPGADGAHAGDGAASPGDGGGSDGRPHADGGRPHADGGGPHADGGGPHADGGGPHADGGGPHADGGGPHADGGRPHHDAAPPADAGERDAGPDASPADAAPPDPPDAAPDPDCPPAADPGPDVPLRREGRFVRTDAFPSVALGRPRGLTVYLPADYDAHPDARYPVLYMHDGQNLFFDEEAAFGASWRVAGTLDALVAEGAVPALIVVGVHNTAARVAEYTPSVDPDRRYGGRAADYCRFLVDELRPWIHWNFRVRCTPGDTAVMGSSFGGLVTLDLLRHYPDVFGRAGAVSPSLWWNRNEAQAWAPALGRAVRAGARVWIDAGGAEGEPLVDGRRSTIRDARALYEALPADPDVAYLEDLPAEHDETAWAGRLAHALRHLWGRPVRTTALSPRVYRWPVVDTTAFSVDAIGTDGRMRTMSAAELDLVVEPPELAAVDGVLLRPGILGGGSLRARAEGQQAILPLLVDDAAGADMTFVVRTPPGTDAVFLTGTEPSLGPWDPAAFALPPAPSGVFAGTLRMRFGAVLEYKYTRGSWELVEKLADGEERPNRFVESGPGPARVDDTVERWRDR